MTTVIDGKTYNFDEIFQKIASAMEEAKGIEYELFPKFEGNGDFEIGGYRLRHEQVVVTPTGKADDDAANILIAWVDSIPDLEKIVKTVSNSTDAMRDLSKKRNKLQKEFNRKSPYTYAQTRIAMLPYVGESIDEGVSAVKKKINPMALVDKARDSLPSKRGLEKYVDNVKEKGLASLFDPKPLFKGGKTLTEISYELLDTDLGYINEMGNQETVIRKLQDFIVYQQAYLAAVLSTAEKNVDLASEKYEILSNARAEAFSQLGISNAHEVFQKGGKTKEHYEVLRELVTGESQAASAKMVFRQLFNAREGLMKAYSAMHHFYEKTLEESRKVRTNSAIDLLQTGPAQILGSASADILKGIQQGNYNYIEREETLYATLRSSMIELRQLVDDNRQIFLRLESGATLMLGEDPLHIVPDRMPRSQYKIGPGNRKQLKG